MATWEEISEGMNLKSAAPGEERPTISISRRQVADWFKRLGGKEVSPIEKPLLTTDHKRKRVEWARKWFDLLADPTKPVAFLDEKWFYTTNRRRRLKILPTTDDENGRVRPPRRPRIRSRRYPVKVMYLGVVACPQPDHTFDGRVLLERVSRRKRLARASRNHLFLVDVLVNDAIKQGDWGAFVSPGDTLDAALETIKTNYDLDEFVSDRLVMGSHSFGQDGKIRWKGLATTTVLDKVGMRTNSVGEQVEVLMNDLELAVQQSAGDEVDEDCSCDSTFMLEKAPRIRSALRIFVLIQALMSALSIAMKKNLFTFGDTFWLQKTGAAMGQPQISFLQSTKPTSSNILARTCVIISATSTTSSAFGFLPTTTNKNDSNNQ
jgi:hypothetical protein